MGRRRRRCCSPLERGAGEHALPDAAEHVELLAGEVLEEVAANALEVRAARGGELVAATRGEDGEGAAGVALARLALEQAVALEAIDETGQAAAAQQDGRGEVVHAQLAVGRVGEVHEDLVGGDGEAMLGLELGVERLDEAGVDAEQAAPGAELLRAQLVPGRCRRRHGCDATRNGCCVRKDRAGEIACPGMALEGLHHVTAITADAPANVDFYARTLGLRLVKKTVNFDAPDVYHLYYGDKRGTPGSILTFFEFPGARRGRAGDGMIYHVAWRVAGPDALDFLAARAGGPGFAAPEGLEHEIVVASDIPDPPLVNAAAGIP